jgi:outer membrane lipoprotein-sorting protein
MWIYLSALQTTRGIVPVDVYERFLGSDFTYSDLGFVSRRGTYRLLGEEVHNGVRAYKVEEVPKEQWYYARIVTWVSADSLLPLQRDYYDRAGRLWRTAIFDQVAVVDGIPTPLRIRMLDKQQNRSTEFQVSGVRYDVDVPDTLFDPQRLAQAVTSSLWQPFVARAAPMQ